MYNRYVPQSDGSFRKNRIPEKAAAPQKPKPKPETSHTPAATHPSVIPPPVRKPTPAPRPTQIKRDGFLRQLLPQGLDTGDILIAVLLLLMAGDCEDDKTNALLTLALYLFL